MLSQPTEVTATDLVPAPHDNSDAPALSVAITEAQLAYILTGPLDLHFRRL